MNDQGSCHDEPCGFVPPGGYVCDSSPSHCGYKLPRPVPVSCYPLIFPSVSVASPDIKSGQNQANTTGFLIINKVLTVGRRGEKKEMWLFNIVPE